MRRNLMLSVAAAVLSAALLSACGGGSAKPLKDGTYTAQSEMHEMEADSEEDDSGYGVVTLTVKGGVITGCTFQTFELDGSLKDKEYGMEGGRIANKDYFNKAQKAVAACDQYAAKLVETGDLKKVDAISGATVNYGQFQETVEEALRQARE